MTLEELGVLLVLPELLNCLGREGYGMSICNIHFFETRNPRWAKKALRKQLFVIVVNAGKPWIESNALNKPK